MAQKPRHAGGGNRMIGVFGIFRDDPAAPVDLAAMADTVPARYRVTAPAGTGAALGRTALKRGVAGGRAVSVDGTVTAVVCGEIFNVTDFGAVDAGANTGAGTNANAGAGAGVDAGDAAGLIARLAAAGTLDRLAEANGQFCAAVYDRARHRLTLITDRLATHALHVWRGGGQTLFATHLGTLVGAPAVPRRAEPLAIAQMFTMQRTVGRITPLAGVSALPAACILEIDADSLRERCYWQLQWRRPDFTPAEGAALLAEALTAALDRQGRGHAVGLTLSGGIDSRLLLAAGAGQGWSCWTTASFEDNPELALARGLAETFGAEHHALIVPPQSTLDHLDAATLAADGMGPSSSAYYAFAPAVGEACDIALTGHGLDYTLRGYYLPARFAEIAGSRTRLPMLRAIPSRPTGADVLANLRQGPPRATLDRIVLPHRRAEWWRAQEAAMEQVLAPWRDAGEPYNLWDAFILHSVSKHYAFSGMQALRASVDIRMPAFDTAVFDIYLRMPPRWRCSGRMVQRALRRLSPKAAHLANANTGFRADLHPWAEVAALMGRGALRRAGLLARAPLPSASHSHGSWQNIDALYRDDPRHRARFTEIRGRLDGLSFGWLSPDGLAACIDEHLSGTRSHAKVMRQLLTHDSWVRTFSVGGSVGGSVGRSVGGRA